MRRSVIAAAALLALAACGKKKEQTSLVQTAPVERRDIVIDAEATGTVEPINVVEVKSKASGQIVKMPVETGTNVKPGDLLVQVDTRDVRNQYDQSLASLQASQERLRVATAQKKRADELFAQRVITATEHETAALDYANAQSAVVSGRTNLDLAKQRLEDATVRAPVAGTVIEKDVSLGQVITSATGAFGGGTTLLKMADLNRIRVRALVNETDIGQLRPGQVATVVVDAYPDRPFQGMVEKIEPQAVVQQSVTMFPVLVTLDNREGMLKPGMNGEVNVVVDRRDNVLAIPNDAVRSLRETQMAAQILGLNADSVQRQVRAQMASAMGGGAAPGDTPAAMPVPAGGARTGRVTSQSRGEVDLQGGQGGFQGAPLPEVTEKQCAEVTAAFAKKPGARATLDSLRQRAMSGEIDFQQVRTESQQIYASLGVDPQVARACMRRGQGSQGGPSGAAGARGSASLRSAQGGQSGAGMPTGASGAAASRGRTRPGLVFVTQGKSYAPRVVRLGVSNFDYVEVVGGLKEGEQVAILSAAALQFQREQSQDRFRNMTSGGMQRTTTGGAAGAGGPGGGGGGRRGPQ